jgi:hypothetical protein
VIESLDKIGSTVPVLVLGNKIDNIIAVSEPTLKKELGLRLLCTGKVSEQYKSWTCVHFFA